MSTQVSNDSKYTIKQIASLTGLSEHTLRYYENIGLIDPIKRDESSKHRVYSEYDLNILDSVACLSATGMSIKNMREYISNSKNGSETAQQQIQLLHVQEQHLAEEAKYLNMRQRYVKLKISYWEAVEKGDEALVQAIADKARSLSRDLKSPISKKSRVAAKNN